MKKFEFIAPSLMYKEFLKDKKRLLQYSKLSEKDFEEYISLIMMQIKPIPDEIFIKKLDEALLIDEKDAPYIALSLVKDCKIFSGDKRLSSKLPGKVISPRELVEILEN